MELHNNALHAQKHMQATVNVAQLLKSYDCTFYFEKKQILSKDFCGLFESS
jgi:hypothetical protein